MTVEKPLLSPSDTAPALAGGRHPPDNGRRAIPWVDLGFGGYCAVVAAVRFAVLTRPGVAPGIDAGNWLTLGHALFGDPLRPSPGVYPPVVPALVVGSVHLFGVVSGVALVAALSSLAPAIAVYLVMRDGGSGWIAAPLAGLLTLAASTGEAAAWGGYPQLLGIGLTVVFLWMVDRALQVGGGRRALATGAVLALTLATSHLAGFVAVVAGLMLVVLRLAQRDRSAGPRPTAATALGLGLFVLPCLPLVPLYLTMARDILPGFGARSSAMRLAPGNLVPSVEYVYRDFPWFWRVAVVLAVLTPLVAGDRRRRPLWRAASSLVAATALFALVTREPRWAYFLPPASVMALGFWLGEIDDAVGHTGRLRQRLMYGGLVGVLAAQSVLGLRLFAEQRDYYGVLTPGIVAGVAWLRDRTPADSLVAVTPVDTAPLGWWVEGLGRRRALTGSALGWLYQEQERTRARQANRIFAPGFPSEDSLGAATAAGADFALVAKTWDGYAPTRVAQFRALHPGSFVFENADVVILRVRASD